MASSGKLPADSARELGVPRNRLYKMERAAQDSITVRRNLQGYCHRIGKLFCVGILLESHDPAVRHSQICANCAHTSLPVSLCLPV